MTGLTRSDFLPIVRHLISFGVGWLVSHKIIPAAQAEVVIGALAIFVLNVAWAFGQRLISKWKLNLALDMPSGSTREDLHEISKEVSATQKISEVLSPPVENAKP